MQPTSAIDIYSHMTMPTLSVSQTFLVLALILPTVAVLGWWFGQNRRDRRIRAGLEIDMVAGEATLGAMMAIFGLLLAFSFGNALTIFEKRKSGLIEESAALGTAFLRADFLAEPGRTELQKALLAYGESRLVPDGLDAGTWEDALAFFEPTLRRQAVLWPLAMEATIDPTPPPIQSLVASAVNDVIDMHLHRLGAMTAPISDHVYLMVLVAAMAALFLQGERTGMLGRSLTWRTFVLSAFLTVVMTTVVDLQRSQSGLIRVDQTPLRATIFDMKMALGAQ